jgi:hypothetical protein
MATTLGTAILTAMAQQGWIITSGEKTIAAINPQSGTGFIVPVALLNDEANEPGLRLVLLSLIVEGGLEWPWPPDLWESIHGELPRIG